eukprot:NODE_515_length_6587_cov_0.940197.p4 type:complete len:295 gc:universal NODE_515_length_6587_cov_0.940197:3934-4818(+)
MNSLLGFIKQMFCQGCCDPLSAFEPSDDIKLIMLEMQKKINFSINPKLFELEKSQRKKCSIVLARYQVNTTDKWYPINKFFVVGAKKEQKHYFKNELPLFPDVFKKNGIDLMFLAFVFNYLDSKIPKFPTCKNLCKIRNCLHVVRETLKNVAEQVGMNLENESSSSSSVDSMDHKLANFKEYYWEHYDGSSKRDKQKMRTINNDGVEFNKKEGDPNIIIQSEYFLLYHLYKESILPGVKNLMLVSKLDICDYCLTMFKRSNMALYASSIEPALRTNKIFNRGSKRGIHYCKLLI